MAHELTIHNGRAEMAFVGETPWHKLGQRLEPGADIDTWKQAAGMDWTIRRGDIMYYADRAQKDMKVVDDTKILYRADNGYKLGLVSNKYQVVQPGEVLEFFRDLAGEGGFDLHTAGTLFGGKRYWALAKVAQGKISGWDEIGGFILLSSTADGTRATEIRETTVRVVCNNTLSMAIAADNKNVIRVSHRETFNADSIKEKLGLSHEHFNQFLETADLLSTIKISNATAENFVRKVLAKASGKKVIVGDDEDEDTMVAETKSRGLEMILGLFDGHGKGSNQKGAKGTAWGLVNAVTEYVDHLAQATTIDHRLDRAFWGTGNTLKSLAFQQAAEQLV